MMKKYDSYKDSGVEWIGEVPEHWVQQKLKYVARVQPSNVDKKSHENEQPTLLCNYVDVYKNDFIVADMDFMEATATPEEIEKFRVDEGDVLVTKDSESADDIAVPAYVKDRLEGVTCGYHLTQIKPDKANLLGGYLFRLFQTPRYNSQFKVFANGVTRYGLSIYYFENALIPLPSIDEQNAIANFLDDKTSQIDSLIQNKQQMIALLEEEKTAVINEAVTKGLNPDAPMKDSGIEWLGMVPAHWVLSKIAYVSTVVRGASPRPAGSPKYFNGSHTPWITVAEVTKDDSKYITSVSSYLTEEGREQSRFIEAGTLVLSNSGATLGVPKILRIGGCINDGSIAFLNLRNSINQDFLYYFFKSLTFTYREMMKGSGQPNLNTDIVKSTNIAVPPTEEQLTIVQHIENKITECNFTISRIRQEIELMQEYRTALISEAVTGKIDVRDYQPESITSTTLA